MRTDPPGDSHRYEPSRGQIERALERQAARRAEQAKTAAGQLAAWRKRKAIEERAERQAAKAARAAARLAAPPKHRNAMESAVCPCGRAFTRGTKSQIGICPVCALSAWPEMGTTIAHPLTEIAR